MTAEDTDRPADRRAEHERAAELLPWYVNGTLPAGERAWVERHVKSCLPCRAALRSELRLAALVRAQPTVQLSADEGFERLRERIARPALPTARHVPWLLATAATAAFAAWLAVDLARQPPPDAEFATLTSGGPATLAIDLVFAPDATEADVRAVVREIGGTIVAGPTELGRYTVALERTDPPADIDALVAALERDRRVRFAARAFRPERVP